MCGTCGCALPDRHHGHDDEHTGHPVHDLHTDAHDHGRPDLRRDSVAVFDRLLDANDREAAHNREHLDHHRVLAINLMSSPGAGKTQLLEATIDALAGRLRLAVIEGDLETENDARRIRAKGVPAVQITTGTACHLDAHMVHHALHDIDLAGLDILFIENVGNLVCPAGFDLGHHLNVTLLSVTEGDDKPAKYPVMFRAADLLLLTKTDLLRVIDDFDPTAAVANFRALANPAPVLPLSARVPASLAGWIAWLDTQLARRRSGAVPQPRAPSEARARHAAATP
ncbi:MAG: hydrogenase nickel incorporation protein HypB [Burkholderiales bacterium]|nr:hydrogenase nickel incorporation protein HypB [Burkholderiales bacterium]